MELDDRLRQATELSVGGAAKSTKASLNLYSTEIDLEMISKVLGCQPTDSHRKGDFNLNIGAPSPIGLWGLQAPDNLSFPAKIEYLVRATPAERSVWDALTQNHTVKLSCGIFLQSWNEGFAVPADLLAEIGLRHWELDLDLYSAGGDQIVDAFLGKPK
jgi:hypothetical protein